MQFFLAGTHLVENAVLHISRLLPFVFLSSLAKKGDHASVVRMR
jgi:hypothetical protein